MPTGYVSGSVGAWLTMDLALVDDLDQVKLSNRLRQEIEKNRLGPMSNQTLCVPAEANQWWIIDPVPVTISATT